FVQQKAIGLDTVAHTPACWPVLALKFHCSLEKNYPQCGWLSSVPGKVDCRSPRRFEMLHAILFQQAYRHLEWACRWVEDALVFVVSVVAIKIAQCSRRFDKNLKIPGGLAHHPSPELIGTLPINVVKNMF